MSAAYYEARGWDSGGQVPPALIESLGLGNLTG
jgi:hypothetical protein